MSFLQSSSNATVGPGPSGTGSFLRATCQTSEGDWIDSVPLNLDDYFGNVNGELKLNEKGFSESAEKIELSDGGSMLNVWLIGDDSPIYVIDLDQLVANEGGNLKFIGLKEGQGEDVIRRLG